MKIIRCTKARHAEPILEILNEAILNTTALYDYKPRTMEIMMQWFDARELHGYPIIGIETDGGELMGFGSYGQFRDRPAYKYSAEHSLYVDTRFRGRGVGKTLLQEIIIAATAQDYHTLIAGIDSENFVSITLHERVGFTSCGKIQHAGFKFGRWLDLVFYQLLLPTPLYPREA